MNCQHDWGFSTNGYSHCKKCGCARGTGKCVQCGEERLNMVILTGFDGLHKKFCSYWCVKHYIQDNQEEAGGNERTNRSDKI